MDLPEGVTCAAGEESQRAHVELQLCTRPWDGLGFASTVQLWEWWCGEVLVFVFRCSGSCSLYGDNHSIKPPKAEQCLMPLPRKEVTVRY